MSRLPRRVGRSGFTLIELLVVVAVFGLILAFAVLRLDGWLPAARLSAGARQVASTVGLVRGEAIAAGLDYGLLYDLKGARFAVMAPPDPEEVESGSKKATDLYPLEWQTLPDGVDFEDVDFGARTVREGTVTVRFTALGTATAHAVHLKGSGDAQYTVEVNPLTGLVDLADGRQKLSLYASQQDFGGGLGGSEW